MALYALDDLDDAYAATRGFLFPFDWRRWLSLAFVVFFVASSTGTPSSGFQFTGAGGGTDTGTTGEFTQAEFDTFVQEVEPFLPLIAAVVVGSILLALLFAVLGAVMEFVLVQSLREDRVAVREFSGRYWRKGVRLFGFRFGLGFLAFLAGVLVFGLTVGPLVVGVDPVIPVVTLVVLGPLFVLFALAIAAVGGFTTVFVVPIMLLEDRNVLSAWRRLWPTLRSQWRQFVVYALVITVVLFALGIVAGIAVAIPVAIVGAVLAVVLGAGFFVGGVTAGTVALAVVLGVPFLLFVFLVAALVQVPIQTYVRYHALLVLGDADERFDLIPEVRRSIREPGQGGVSGPTSAD